MFDTGTTTPLTGTSALLLGLVLGLFGSLADDVAGAPGIVQIMLWAASGALILTAVLGFAAGRGTHRDGGRHAAGVR